MEIRKKEREYDVEGKKKKLGQLGKETRKEKIGTV